MSLKNKRIFLAGHKGMVGSAILRKLKTLKVKVLIEDKSKLNLINQKKVFNFLKKNKPDYVIIAAARVGGINANNTFKSKFIYENLQIQNNLIHGAFLAGVKNLIFLGSSCIYPKNIKKKIKEEDLLTGELENTNDAYALAKICGLKMCEYYSKEFNLNYKSLMPTNLYGPGDNYDTHNSHFIPALIKKIYICKVRKKKILNIWGSGKPLREVMYVDDLADACIFFIKKKIKEPYINIGSGCEKKIIEFAKIIIKMFNCNLKFKYDKSKPSGNYRKRLNLYKANQHGWRAKVSLEEGLKLTIADFLKNYGAKVLKNK